MNKTVFSNIVRAYQKAMGSMLEANRLQPGRGALATLTEIGVDLLLHLPSFIDALVNMDEAKVPKSVKAVATSLGNAYSARRGVSPRAVLIDAGLLLAALSNRLPEETNPKVAELVDQARAHMRKDDIYLEIEGVVIDNIPQSYDELS